jgi:2-oxo-4-hydroxy-4-carboxy--5-ureidoimidazoline (OHCU) decarboxylase
VHDVPRKLSVDELAELFGAPTRFVRVLAEREDPLGEARDVLRRLSEEEQIEAINAHPRIGEPNLHGRSAAEQGSDADPAVLSQLAYVNQVYEEKFGFRFLVFVNRRPKAAIVPVLEERLARTRKDELGTAFDELVAIARDRWERAVT